MDWLHKALNWIDYHRYVVAAVIILAAIMAWGLGCESMTASLTEPAKKVTRQQFEREGAASQVTLAERRIELDAAVAKYNEQVKANNAAIAAGQADLQRQDEVRLKLFEIAGAMATQGLAGQLTPAAVIGTLITVGSVLLAGGAIGDKRRTDGVLAALKNGSSQPAATSEQVKSPA